MARKLKVFRTSIGFHDAYVAAPSQQAALEAWGSSTNLFGTGLAEQVTDPKLVKGPLAAPGQVIKVKRGSQREHLAALPRTKPAAGSSPRSKHALSRLTARSTSSFRLAAGPSLDSCDLTSASVSESTVTRHCTVLLISESCSADRSSAIWRVDALDVLWDRCLRLAHERDNGYLPVRE
ncbi:hypothetical protein [Sphingomonas sp. TF3]|uniref:hypothetical protein n=1 Tax=Sphingomonas sp. TF3 TaxID=2495580 RepID=UPI00163BBC70|nr:hypothetical protein [Sphingomonas sp. TF3]